MAFRDLEEFLTPAEPIKLPIRGKVYEFPGRISAQAWLLMQESMRAAATAESPDKIAVTDEKEAIIEDALFGDQKAEMIADGLTPEHLRVVFMTLFAWHTRGEEVAERVWEAQGEPLAPNRAARRHPKSAARSRGSRAASTAPKQSAPAGSPSSSSGQQ